MHSYEQGDINVISQLYCGYPRFCLHPYVTQLFNNVAKRYGNDVCDIAYVFPNQQSVQRCIQFIHKQLGTNIDIKTQRLHNAGQCTAILFNHTIRKTVHTYWQHTGDIVSSRQAHSILENRWLPIDPITYNILKHRIASYTTKSPNDVYLLCSGMNALSSSLRFVESLQPNKQTIQIGFSYLDTLKMQTVISNGAYYFNSAGADELKQIEQLLQSGCISGIFTEFPSNPLLQCIDLPAVYQLCQKYNTVFIVDDTVASFVSISTIQYCDISVASLSKIFSGNGDILAGCAIINNNSKFYNQYKSFMSTGQQEVLYRCDADVLEYNSRDVVQRVNQSINNASILVEYLKSHPLINTVNTAISHVSGIQKLTHNILSGLFSFTIHGGELAAQTFYDNLQCCKGPGLGTNFTLVCPYTLLAHYSELEWCESLGISRYLIRVSCGQEDSDELIRRFDIALQSVHNVLQQQLPITTTHHVQQYTDNTN